MSQKYPDEPQDVQADDWHPKILLRSPRKILVESRFPVKFFRFSGGMTGTLSMIEIDPPADGQTAVMMSKSEILARWDAIKYQHPQQIVVVTDGKIIACSTFAVTVPLELVWLYDSAQDRLDAKIAHLKK